MFRRFRVSEPSAPRRFSSPTKAAKRGAWRRSLSFQMLLWYLVTCGGAPALDANTSDILKQAAIASPDPSNGEKVYRDYCIRCHRARGSGTGGREYPELGGQQEQYLLEELAQFIALDRYAPKMHQILGQGTLAEPQTLRDLSAYLAAQRTDAHGEHGDGFRLKSGRARYDQHCAQCHGEFGRGRAVGPIPAIGGQNYTYLLTQLKGFGAGHRAKVDPAATDAVTHLSPEQMSAVADYVSRMPASVDIHYGAAFP